METEATTKRMTKGADDEEDECKMERHVQARVHPGLPCLVYSSEQSTMDR
jgi:hypothetical protein